MTPHKKIHIVHITQHLEIGGLESFIVEFCKKMDTDRFRATVLCLNAYDQRYKADLEQHGIRVHLIRKKHRYDIMFLFRAAAFLREIQTDIIHSHGGCFFYSSLIGKLARVRQLVYTAHGMPVSFGLQARIEEYLSCVMTDRIIAVSDEIAADLVSRNRSITAKLKIIINGIDTGRYRPIEDCTQRAACKAELGLPQKTRIIGSVGRLEKVKNYPLLLRACAKLLHDYDTDFHLVLVGSGSEEDNLKTLTRKLGIAEKVSFPGMQYDLQKIYPIFDVFVLSSLTEGTSLSLLEAQACGIPAVVTDVGGNANIIKNGVNGLLCPSNNHIAMAALLECLLNSDEIRLPMKTSSRAEILKRFDLSCVLNNYQDIYCKSGVAVHFPSSETVMASYDTPLP